MNTIVDKIHALEDKAWIFVCDQTRVTKMSSRAGFLLKGDGFGTGERLFLACARQCAFLKGERLISDRLREGDFAEWVEGFGRNAPTLDDLGKTSGGQTEVIISILKKQRKLRRQS